MRTLTSLPSVTSKPKSLAMTAAHLVPQSVSNGERRQSIAPPIVSDVLSSAGQPLDTHTRVDMERRFGHDFSRVRIHADARAAESARAVDAFAYTVGQRIIFGTGQFQPGSMQGRRILAHELAHVIQQSNAAQPGVVQRWSISGKFATSDKKSDTLGGLAQAVGANVENWRCIRPTPLSMSIAYSKDRPADFDEHYDRYITAGDRFDISNLTKEKGASLNIHLFDAANPYAGVAQQFYPGIAGTNDAADAIFKTALSGRNPIANMLIFGHAHEGTMFGDTGVFKPKETDPEQPGPSFSGLQEGKFPQRCWFTRNAVVRSVGCDTETWGQDFASHYLRVGASITTTMAPVQGICSGKSPEYVAIAGDCRNKLDGLEFRMPGGDWLDGPFWTTEKFHSAGWWSKIDGKL